MNDEKSLYQNMPGDTITGKQTIGGMRHYEKMGEYRNILTIHSELYNKTWSVKVKDEIKEGVLKLSKEAVYNYQFKDSTLNLQKIKNGLPDSDWIEILLDITMMNYDS